MDSSAAQKQAIAFGKQLAAHLHEHTNDEQTIRWMAFYIAEVITRAEAATGPDKAAAEKEAFEAILALWSRRRAFPGEVRPFEKFEPIIGIVGRLDPEAPNPYYYNRLARIREGKEKEPDATTKWLDFVERVDQLARNLVSAGLGRAAQSATDESTKTFLKAVAGEERSDIDSVAALLALRGKEGKSRSEQVLAKQIKDIELLEHLAAVLKADLKTKLADETAKRKVQPLTGDTPATGAP